RQLLLSLCSNGDNSECMAILQTVLDRAAAASADAIQQQKINELTELLQAMQDGPLRYATFIKMLNHPGPVRRAQVVLQDGTSAFSVVPDGTLAESLRCGDTVLLEAQGKALLFRDPDPPSTGEEARLERRIDEERVQVSVRDHERFIFRASADL